MPVTSSDPAAEGRRRADEYLTLLTAGDPAADALLEELTEVRDLVYLGAGLTAVARTEGRALPHAQRAQASTRQVHLGQQRDRSRGDVAGLRDWLRASGAEILFIRSLHDASARLQG